jgi:probable rRNA maturation factor
MEIKVYTNKQVSSDLKQPLKRLVRQLVQQLGLETTFIHVVFLTDAEIKQLHYTYLQQDTVTDVMTFNLNDYGAIEGEIYISAQRALDQSRDYAVPFEQEICRLVIHGCLHLAGYTDRDRINRKKMKQKEDALVERYNNLVASCTN